jgi:hypothetical protein
MFAVVGCSGPKTGTVATTDEDEIAEYNRMINEGEGEDPEPEE